VFEGRVQSGKPNYEEAIKLWIKAADVGDVEAMNNLGGMYYKGEGQPGNKPNLKEAIKWSKKAADAGHVDAMFNLGGMYHHGEGQPGNKPNYKEALKWYKKAAGLGHAGAMFNLGWMYDKGEGQPGSKPNYKEALKWYTKAAEGEIEEAKVKVVEMQKLIPSDKSPKEVSVSDLSDGINFCISTTFTFASSISPSAAFVYHFNASL
jgi:TPR repeat protein